MGTNGHADREASGRHQEALATHVAGTHRRTLEAFEEIMAGPNPLTRAEVEAMIAKRPNRYGSLLSWLQANPY